MEERKVLEIQNEYKFGFSDEVEYKYKSQKGLSADVVREISRIKNEPEWMLNIRLKALDIFNKLPMPTWGGNVQQIDFDEIYYYARATDGNADTWEDVPDAIKDTFEKLGIPEAEREYLAGVAAQYDSEVVYHNIHKDLADKGVIFCDTDTAVQKYPELVQKYFATVIPAGDNKFSALNTAVWSGGSFIWVPPGVSVDIPLQAYFRINAKNVGQFERTLILAEPGSFVHYVEGCSAPIYSTDSLHSAVVEIIAMEGARVRYTTIQNWSNNVYNLVTKRAVAHKKAIMEWIDGNIGSKLTMKYPAIFLKGEGAHGEVISIAMAGKGQHQDAGAKVVHLAPNTSSVINSKSISHHTGRTTYRGLVKISKDAVNAKCNVKCDTLMFDEGSLADTIPYMEIENPTVHIEHEATVSKVSEEQLFYLMSRGLSEQDATNLIVSGFVEPFTKQLPMEYAVELNRLIELEMEGSVG